MIYTFQHLAMLNLRQAPTWSKRGTAVNAKDTHLYTLYVGLHIWPLITSLIPAIINVNGNFNYCTKQKISRPFSSVVLNWNKSNKVLSHPHFLSIHQNTSQHNGHLLLVPQVRCTVQNNWKIFTISMMCTTFSLETPSLRLVHFGYKDQDNSHKLLWRWFILHNLALWDHCH